MTTNANFTAIYQNAKAVNSNFSPHTWQLDWAAVPYIPYKDQMIAFAGMMVVAHRKLLVIDQKRIHEE